jgi:hypothetical protein
VLHVPARSFAPFILLVLAALAVLPAPAAALVNIRAVRWEWVENHPYVRHDTAAPVDTVSRYRVNFDADVGLADLEEHAFRFALAERDASPDQDDVLLRIALSPCEALPPLGAEVTVVAEFGLYCDRESQLHGWTVRYWAVTWCSAPSPTSSCSGWFPPTEAVQVSESEKFELVVLDEKGGEAPNPTEEDLMRCLWDAKSGSLRPAGLGPGNVLPGSADPAQALDSGSIGIYADSLGTRCSVQATPFVPFKLYVLGKLQGLTSCGIAVSEFGIEGMPSGFYSAWKANPRAQMQLGSPLTTAGLSFEPCESGGDGIVHLYTLEVVPTTEVHDVVLQVRGGSPPTNADFPCPWFSLCDRAMGLPLYTKRCLETPTFIINPSPGNDCVTSVEPRSWGDVKALYR